MAHRVHPKIFRIRQLQDWSSRWFQRKNFANALREDFLIRQFFKKNFPDLGIESIEIERFPGEVKIILKSARPGLLIGRGGEGIEKIKNQLQKELFGDKDKDKDKKNLKLEVVEVREIWSKASLVAQWIARQLERRVPHRRVLKQALDKMTSSKEVKGAKVEVAGRLEGAEIARRVWLKKGQLPRQTLRANIDYAQEEAKTTYGVIGVKVWVYK